MRAVDATGGAYQYDRGDPAKPRLTLTGAARIWPTPTAQDCYSHGETEAQRNTPALNHQATGGHGGTLNPTWVEWLMGFPTGFTDLEHSETQ